MLICSIVPHILTVNILHTPHSELSLCRASAGFVGVGVSVADEWESGGKREEKEGNSTGKSEGVDNNRGTGKRNERRYKWEGMKVECSD